MSVEFVTFATPCVTHPLNFAKIHNLNIGLLLVSAFLATLGCGNRANCLTTANHSQFGPVCQCVFKQETAVVQSAHALPETQAAN